MKVLAYLIIVCMVCMGLSGCTYSTMNLIRAKGGEMRANWSVIGSASGKDMAVTAFRQMFCTTEDKKKVPPVPDLRNMEETGMDLAITESKPEDAQAETSSKKLAGGK